MTPWQIVGTIAAGWALTIVAAVFTVHRLSSRNRAREADRAVVEEAEQYLGRAWVRIQMEERA